MVTIELTQKTHYDLVTLIDTSLKDLGARISEFERECNDPTSYVITGMNDFERADFFRTSDMYLEQFQRIISELKQEPTKKNIDLGNRMLDGSNINV